MNTLVNTAADCLIVDANCARYGDSVFDLAFVVNHLCLKAVHDRGAARPLVAAIHALLCARAAADAPGCSAAVERRAAQLLPGPLLARLDGKSPVEYLTDEGERSHIPEASRRFLLSPAGGIDDIVIAPTGRTFP
jgi:hypothetical protein